MLRKLSPVTTSDNNSISAERENISPTSLLFSFNLSTQAQIIRIGIEPDGQNSEDKSTNDVSSRANLSYLAKLNRNNPTKLSSFGVSGEPVQASSKVEGSKSLVVDDQGILSDFVRSFYEAPNYHPANPKEMRRSPRIAVGVGRRSSRSRKSTSPKKRSVSVGTRRGKKRRQSIIADDSVMIISPLEMSGTDTDFTPTPVSESEGVSKRQEQKPKRIRLFPSLNDGRNVSKSINETIDLVDVEDDDNHPNASDEDDVILLEEDSAIKTTNQDVEIVGVRIVAPLSSSRQNSSSPWTRSGSRTSFRNTNNISFQNIQQAVKRAKKRVSLSKATKTLALKSRNIKKKKGKTQVFCHSSRGNRVIQPSNLYPSRNQRYQNRRSTIPIYKLDQELGPRNPQWNKAKFASVSKPAAPAFIPFNATIIPSTSEPLMAASYLDTNTELNQVTSTTAPAPPEAFNLMCVAGGSGPQFVPGTRRPIIIDASNVAMSHAGNNGVFSCQGIQICVDYFRSLGHTEIIAFVPRYRHKNADPVGRDILQKLEQEGVLKYTPSREAGRLKIASYDDRYIVQYANQVQGIIISNDNYKDIFEEQVQWRDQISFRILQFTWVTPVCIMFPMDPLGQGGPPLQRFLRY